MEDGGVLSFFRVVEDVADEWIHVELAAVDSVLRVFSGNMDIFHIFSSVFGAQRLVLVLP